MNETEKIKFIGYDLEGNKIDRTINGVVERFSTELKKLYSPLDKADYNFIVFRNEPNLEKKYKMTKVELKRIVGDYEETETIYLNGIAYVMNQNGTTVDTIKSGR